MTGLSWVYFNREISIRLQGEKRMRCQLRLSMDPNLSQKPYWSDARFDSRDYYSVRSLLIFQSSDF